MGVCIFDPECKHGEISKPHIFGGQGRGVDFESIIGEISKSYISAGGGGGGWGGGVDLISNVSGDHNFYNKMYPL